ncbi:hypothetical protein K7W42_01405 [Deinococcus sp. HMF7604]|uniref:hypothetical protein n=1 Tax=Deinococcus betulae TaxID=2873312 RepID=UPI001CCE7BF2|nr:hypothetical protein [Deinococcus betulae]MBZ9749510.1 hypothetical protein [Deinococcus betulae]
MNSEPLRATLHQLLQQEAAPNRALAVLLGDYATYHAALALLAGGLSAACLLLTFSFWRRFCTAAGHGWRFETRLSATFGALSVILGSLLGLLTLANAGNALHPKAGFEPLLSLLGRGSGAAAQREATFNAWLQSGQAALPGALQTEILERLAWQQPKALLCGLLCVVLVALSARIWGHLIRRFRQDPSTWTLRERGLMVSGGVTVSASLPLLVMFLANTQASLAPITLTLLYG